MKFTWLCRALTGLLLCNVQIHFAQCTDCVADLTCVGVDGFPAVCPEFADTAYTNAYYEEFLTFYIPSQVTDPGSGINATLLSVEVVSVAGLPFGLEFTLSDADGIFYPSQGENYGCATICGTPLIPGVYDVQIAVNIVAEALGFEVNQSETFPYTIVVEPGEGGTGSFTFDNTAACGNLLVQYEASLVAPLPSVTEYDWDFGNGNSSSLLAPPAVLYDLAGTYNCTLTTTISDFHLNQIAITALASNWGNDIDDVFSTCDTYFTLTDDQGNTVFTSAVIDNNNTPSWSGLNLLLSSTAYTVTFFDEDDLTADDNLGNTTLQLQAGAVDFNIPSGTSGSLQCSLDITTSVTDSVAVNVFENPQATFWVNGTQLYFDAPEIISYQWYINQMPLSNQTANSIQLSEGGEYSCWVTNMYGCSGWSNTYLYCPEITPTYDPLAQEVTVDQGFASYQWFFNGELLEGANAYYHSATAFGNYSVLITTDYGCTTLSNVVNVASEVTEKRSNTPVVFPNPVISKTTVMGISPGSSIRVFDANGQLMMTQRAIFNAHELDLSSYPSGLYTIHIQAQSGTTILKFVKL